MKIEKIQDDTYNYHLLLSYEDKIFFTFESMRVEPINLLTNYYSNSHMYDQWEKQNYTEKNIIDTLGDWLLANVTKIQDGNKLEVFFNFTSLKKAALVINKWVNSSFNNVYIEAFEEIEITNTKLSNVKLMSKNFISNSEIINKDMEVFVNSVISDSSLFNTSVDTSTISNNSKISNIKLSDDSTIEKSNIINKSMEILKNSYIQHCPNIKNISGSNFKINKSYLIENVYSSSKGDNFSIINESNIEEVLINNSKINNSKVKNFDIRNSELKNIENMVCLSKTKSLIEKGSYLSDLMNIQIIEGCIEIFNSSIISKNIIFQNKKDEKITIMNSIIDSDASIFGNSYIDNAHISGNATIFENAKIIGRKEKDKEFNSLKIAGYSKIFGKSIIKGSPKISGFVNIYGESEVHDNSIVYGSVNILDDSRVSGESKLFKKEIVNKYEERYE